MVSDISPQPDSSVSYHPSGDTAEGLELGDFLLTGVKAHGGRLLGDQDRRLATPL
jgi:hypothetical protein